MQHSLRLPDPGGCGRLSQWARLLLRLVPLYARPELPNAGSRGDLEGCDLGEDLKEDLNRFVPSLSPWLLLMPPPPPLRP